MKKVIKKEILKLLADNDNQYNLKKLRKSIIKITGNSSNSDNCIDDDAVNKSFALALDSLLEKEKIVIVKDNVVINTSNDDSNKKKKRYDDDHENNNEAKKKHKNKHNNDDDDDNNDNDNDPSDDEMQTRQYATNEMNKMNNDNSNTNDINNDNNAIKGDTTILLFYAYCDPQMTRSGQDAAIAFCYKTLKENEVTGRLRIGREGFNGNNISNS